MRTERKWWVFLLLIFALVDALQLSPWFHVPIAIAAFLTVVLADD